MLTALTMIALLGGAPAQNQVLDLVYSQDFARGLPAGWTYYDNWSKPQMSVVQDSPLGPGAALKMTFDDKSTVAWFDKGALVRFAEPVPWTEVDFVGLRYFVEQPVGNLRVFFHDDQGAWWNYTRDNVEVGKAGVLRANRNEFHLAWRDDPSKPAPTEPAQILQMYVSIHNARPVNSGEKYVFYITDFELGTRLLPIEQPVAAGQAPLKTWALTRGREAVAIRCGKAVMWGAVNGDRLELRGSAPEKTTATLDGRKLRPVWRHAKSQEEFTASAALADLPAAPGGGGAVKIDLALGGDHWQGRGLVVRALSAAEALGLSLRTGGASVRPAHGTTLASKPVAVAVFLPAGLGETAVSAQLVTGSKAAVPMRETAREEVVGGTEVMFSSAARNSWIQPGRQVVALAMKPAGGGEIDATCPVQVEELDRAALQAEAGEARQEAKALAARAREKRGEKWWATSPLTTVPQIRDRERVDPAQWSQVKDPVTWADFGGAFQGGAQCGIGAGDLKEYFDHYHFGKIIKPHLSYFLRPGWQDNVKQVMAKGLSVMSVWGYVPNAKWNGGFGDAVMPRQDYDELLRIMGRRFLGFEMGEQDGRYIGSYAPKYQPATRAQARKLFDDWHRKIMDLFYGRMVALGSLNFSHEYARLGLRILGLETAQGLPSDIMEWSFLRGAAKQFGELTWNCISVYNRWGYKSYTSAGANHGPDKGTSVQLMKRLWYVTYMYGSACNMFEGAYFTAKKDADGFPKLSPVGQEYVAAVQWARSHADRGVLYAPVAVMLDRDSGWVPPRHLYTGARNLVWGNLPYSRGDYATDAFFRKIWPEYEDASYYQDERGFLTATPYGDMFDVIESDAPAACLRRYQTVIVMGEVTMDEGLVRRLTAFVEGGGEVVCDAAAAQALGPQMTGLIFSGERKAAQMSVLTATGRVLEEDPYTYAVASPAGAKAVALSEHGDGILWAHEAGRGKVITCGASCFVAAKTQDRQEGVAVPLKYKLLRAFMAGIDPYLRSLSPVTVLTTGAPVQWLVNVGRDQRRLIVTLSNNEHRPAQVKLRVKRQTIESVSPWLGQAELRDGTVAVSLPERGIAIVALRLG